MLLYEKETSKILEACINVFNELGCGFLEPVYQEALAIEFGYLGIPFKREQKLEITYRGKKLCKEYYADFICYDSVIVELKAVSTLVKAHKAQVINYLKATKKEIGLLVNFGAASLDGNGFHALTAKVVRPEQTRVIKQDFLTFYSRFSLNFRSRTPVFLVFS